MEFTVSRNRLLLALQHTRQAISKKNTYCVFENFVLTFDEVDCLMTVHTSSGEVWMDETIVLDEIKGDRHPISICYHDLLPAIKALDQQPLRFVVGEMQMAVYHSIGRFCLPLTNSCDEFLSLKAPCPDVEAKDCHLLSYEAPVLSSIINRCSYAMAQDFLRPIMNGLCINLTEDYSDYVSSNGRILVRVRKKPVKYSYSNETAVTSFIIPARIVRILQRVLPKTGNVDIEYQEKLDAVFVIIDDNLKIAFRPVDGRYPNYLSVLPKYSRYEMLIDRRALTKSLDRLVLFANVSNEMVRMTISRDKIQLRTEDHDFAVEGEEALPCECNLDTDVMMQIGMKATSLSKTLKTMSTQKIAFHIEDSSRAIIINPQPQPDNEELTYLIMPMLCNND